MKMTGLILINNLSLSHVIIAISICVERVDVLNVAVNATQSFVHYVQKKMMLMLVSIVKMPVMVVTKRQCVSGLEYPKNKRAVGDTRV